VKKKNKFFKKKWEKERDKGRILKKWEREKERE
jgi:hypothetical protein